MTSFGFTVHVSFLFFSFKPALLCSCLGIQKVERDPATCVVCWMRIRGEINSDANESVSNLLAAEECVLH